MPYIYIYIDGHAKVGWTSVKVYIIYFSKGGVRGEYGGWSWDDRSFVNLKDNFMKFEVVVQNRVQRRCQNDFSPGGTHRGHFTILTGFGQFLTLEIIRYEKRERVPLEVLYKVQQCLASHTRCGHFEMSWISTFSAHRKTINTFWLVNFLSRT